jgi:hypothetical protein
MRASWVRVGCVSQPGVIVGSAPSQFGRPISDWERGVSALGAALRDMVPVWADDSPGRRCRPITSSADWSLKRNKREGKYERIGWVKSTQPEALVDVLRSLGLSARFRPYDTNGVMWDVTRLLVCKNCGGYLTGKKSRGKQQYVCRNRVHKGPSACPGGYVWEAEMVSGIVAALERDFLNPDFLALLRKELIRQIEEAQKSGDADRLRDRHRELEREIKQGTDNLVLADAAVVPLLSAALAQRKRECDEITLQLDKMQDAVVEVEREVEAAERYLWQLRDSLEGNNSDELRAVLHEAVEKIELKLVKTGGRAPSWEKGVIWLRGAGERVHLGTSTSTRPAHGGA